MLADGYAKKLQGAGFTVAEGIKALRPYDGDKRRQSAAASTCTARILRTNRSLDADHFPSFID